MAKRKLEASDPIESATVSPETASPETSAPELPFELGTWNGLTQWRCRRCPWDTLAGAEAVLAHIREVHEPPMRPPSPPLIAIADRWGHEVRPAGAGSELPESPPRSTRDRVSHPAEEE